MSAVLQSAPRRNDYLLGHSPSEQQRLIDQSRFIGGLTAQVFRDAGLRQGMRVLDIGCGVGDVSLLAAAMVGPSGSVLGVDRSFDAVRTARRRVDEARVRHARFVEHDLEQPGLEDIGEPFDAIVGRLVLMYLADPSRVLQRLARLLNPGGLLVFHEIDIDGVMSEPRCPLFELAVARVRRAFVRAGCDPCFAMQLGPIFESAGLGTPTMTLASRVERGPASPIYAFLADVTRTLLPVIERSGIATAAEVDVDTLARRLRDEAVARDATLVSPAYIGAWANTAAVGNPRAATDRSE